jgi:hypothetical protein
VKHDADDTGCGWKTDARIDAKNKHPADVVHDGKALWVGNGER